MLQDVGAAASRTEAASLFCCTDSRQRRPVRSRAALWAPTLELPAHGGGAALVADDALGAESGPARHSPGHRGLVTESPLPPCPRPWWTHLLTRWWRTPRLERRTQTLWVGGGGEGVAPPLLGFNLWARGLEALSFCTCPESVSSC